MYKPRQERYPSSRLTPSRKVIKQIYQNVKLPVSSQPLTDRCWCRTWQPWHPNETNIPLSKWIVLQSCQKRHTKDDGSLEIQRVVQKCWAALCAGPAAVTRNWFVAGNRTVSPPVGMVEWKEMSMISMWKSLVLHASCTTSICAAFDSQKIAVLMLVTS